MKKKQQYFKWVANDLKIGWCYTEKGKIYSAVISAIKC